MVFDNLPFYINGFLVNEGIADFLSLILYKHLT